MEFAAGDGDGKSVSRSHVDCDRPAAELGNVRSANLVLLGFAVAAMDAGDNIINPLFCSIEDINQVLTERFSGKKKVLDAAVGAVAAGYGRFESIRSSR